MAGNSYLLDTNIIAALFKGEKNIADKMDEATDVCIPTIVMGELHYGAQYSTKVRSNTKNINRLSVYYKILNATENTALIYGIIKANLRKKGKPIPENDIWIAAIAQENELTLVTRDKHFDEIEGLQIVCW